MNKINGNKVPHRSSFSLAEMLLDRSYIARGTGEMTSVFALLVCAPEAINVSAYSTIRITTAI